MFLRATQRKKNGKSQFMGFLLDREALLGRNVDVIDWNAARNPFFERHAERSAKELNLIEAITV
jgi:hypothetical protein